MSPAAFFPDRSQRPVLDFVVQTFPFPLAITYDRLHQELDKQEPLAAAWQLRDAFECLLKFCACTAMADFLQAPHAEPDTAKLIELLCKPSGLSLGDWHTLLEMALKPLEPLAGAQKLELGARRLPDLFGVFFKPNGRSTELNRQIDGDAGAFVNWRNRVFGHGVFQTQRQYYASETQTWLPILHGFYSALRPVFAGWTLVGDSPGGERVTWQGTLDLPAVSRHEHHPWGQPLDMLLVRDGSAARLPLSPLLSVQECTICRQPAAFFFDRHRYERKKNQHRTHFVEYFRGHQQERKDWEKSANLAKLLGEDFVWQRTSYDSQEVVEGARITFRDFASEYRRPDYLLDVIWQIVDQQRKGYIHVVGPPGTGKTYLVKGLGTDAADSARPKVLAYHILPGALTDCSTFVVELPLRAT